MLLVHLDDGALWQRRDPAGRPEGDVSPQPPRRGARTERTIAIVPAARMRTLALALPPAPPEKLPRVVRFALEEQLAGDVNAQHVVIAGTRGDATIVHALDRAWLAERIARLATDGMRLRKVVAESDLVPAAAPAAMTWVWREDGGFVIATNGRVSILDRGDDALPAALLLALRREPPAEVVVRGPPALAADVDAWSRATETPFALADAWQWSDADLGAIDSAVDLATPDLAAPQRRATPDRTARWWRRATAWAVAALVLHVLANAAEWIVLRIDTSRVERETSAIAAAAITAAAAAPASQASSGAARPAGNVASATSARNPPAQADLVTWQRTFSTARHRQGRAAPDDALPLLADTALALSELPPSSVRVIQYEAGQLTLDVEKSAASALASAAANWSSRGLAVLQAELPGTLRVRITRD